MVDLGGGNSGQYLADKCCSDSASTLQYYLNETDEENKSGKILSNITGEKRENRDNEVTMILVPV